MNLHKSAMPRRSCRRLVNLCNGAFLLALLAIWSVHAASQIKVIKLAVTNPSPLARPSENIAIPVSALRAIAKDFTAGTVIVTTSEAATRDQDARTLQTTELPSQADDLDGDGKWDELAFQIDLKPHQTRIVTLAYGDAPTIQRLRSQYPQRTDARFAAHYEGPGWESEETAWRIYFDKRNAIDLFGKRRPGLYLDLLLRRSTCTTARVPSAAIFTASEEPSAWPASAPWWMAKWCTSPRSRTASGVSFPPVRCAPCWSSNTPVGRSAHIGGPGEPHHAVGRRARSSRSHHGQERRRPDAVTGIPNKPGRKTWTQP